MGHSVKVGASHTPSQTHLPLTSQSPRTHRWVPSHSLTASCAFCAAGWCQALTACPSSMTSSALAADPACRRAGALKVRYPAAAGGAEKAHSRQRRWCLWSKPVNVGACGLVPDPIVMTHAFSELGFGTAVHTRDNGFRCVGAFRATPRSPESD